MEITSDRKKIFECLQQRFAFPTYQRDYKWEIKHLQELLTDIQESFLDNYDPTHGRVSIGEYSPYFLGTIITTPSEYGYKAIVDGQQRLATLTLILIYFFRLSKGKTDLHIANLEQCLRRDVYGQSQFNIRFDEPRTLLLNILINSNHDEENDTLYEQVESIPGLDPGAKRMFEIFTNIENFLVDQIKESLVPHFVDYLIEKVFLFEISVPSEQDGHKVFVTMNDRGLKLSPIDLLKGFFLSKIKNNESNKVAHLKWIQCIKDLRDLGSDEDSAFFKTFLRSQFANTIRGKSKGDLPGDFENIGDSYYRWVMDNTDRLGLENEDNYYDFLTITVPFFTQEYIKIKNAETSFHPSLPYVFYNGARDLTLQSMAILSAITSTDTSTEINKKIKIVSFFLDYLASLRSINQKDNTYDNVRDLIFSLVRKIRSKNSTDLKSQVFQEIELLEDSISSISQLTYTNTKRQVLLHLLGRIADYIEERIDQTNKVGFSSYIDRARGSKTFDIEHIIPNKPLEVIASLDQNNDFSSHKELEIERNSIGALILLPRGRNRSLKDLFYNDKISRYATENVLAQSLVESFYANNPQVNDFITTDAINMGPTSVFNKHAIEVRKEFYKSIALKIWDKRKLNTLT